MRSLPIFFSLVLCASCIQQKQESITGKEDYNHYLQSKPATTSSKYFDLWNSKIQPDSMQLTSFGIVAGEYDRYFKNTGEVRYLKKAGQALEKAVEIAAVGKADYQRALARNYISQHRFREALVLANSARSLGSGVTGSQNLLFDVHMELGNYDKAKKYLDSTINMSDFGYLIRLAKWSDYKGDLENTIRFMEKAKLKAESARNKTLRLWSYTNLADYYGHAGRIKESYDHYLKSLELDPQNAYAKKGIAWIVFSYEKNPREALRILDSVTQTFKAPDYYLLKAEIADFMGDDRGFLSNLDLYFKTMCDPQYGSMYNMYNIGLYTDQTQQYDLALELAKKEVQQRPTPEVFGLLAYAYYKRGDLEPALAITEQQIFGKTHEPAVLMQAAEIYSATCNTDRVKELKPGLLGAIYELGPAAESKIINL
ncbi:MAG TPA: hypothetical protein VKN36_06150 [Eudoraea sp.]|nr:hypothetical protein [Eudoraea sp.]